MPSSEIERIRVQLRNAVADGGWHGPALLEIVDGLEAAGAAARPLPGAHSAWEIALHVLAWLETVARRLRGEISEPTQAENWPDVTRLDHQSRAAWSDVKGALTAVHEELQRILASIDEADLGRTVPGRDYDSYFMLHGVIQHTLYHAGQIAILARGARAPASVS